ncbi:hypothetical protein [Pseudomonas sp. MWU13-2100]|uniref:hypothetical protein n=1 Tax=Pseudomonas sp. MWU13-2100 TaxID=2935075 RepID=UPI00200E4E9A|nr:hypothetical protein [Pseudomonas sp. MWU13-2100]
MQEKDLPTAIMQTALELKRHNIDLGPHTRIAFDINSSLTSCPAVMLLPAPIGSINSTHYQILRATHSAPRVPDTTLDDLWACTQEHYGLTAAAAITGAAGIPISKTAVGAWVHVGSSKTTNLASYIGWRFFPRALIRQPTAARMAKATFGTVHVFGIIGRGIPFVAAGLAVFDLVSIGLCAYEAKHGK